MKRSLYIFRTLPALLLMLAACSDEALVQTPDNSQPATGFAGQTDAVVLAMNISLPSTRSETDSDGGSSGQFNGGYDSDGNPQYNEGTQTEGGKTNEDVISSIFLEFYKEVSGVWKKIEGYSYDITFSNNTVDIEVPVDLIKEEFAGNKIRVRMVANVSGVSTDDDQKIGFSTIENVGESVQNIPMANYKDYEVDFSKLSRSSTSFVQDLFSLMDSNRTINLTEGAESASDANIKIDAAGTLDLERCWARFDFKPANGKDGNGQNLPANVYQVGEIPNLYVQMNSLQVFNVSQNIWLMRHIVGGDDKKAKDEDATVLGFENDNDHYGEIIDSDLTTDEIDPSKFNWVQDTDWDLKGWDKTTAGSYLYQSATAGWGGPVKAPAITLTSDVGTHYFLNQPVKNNDGYYSITETDGLFSLAKMGGPDEDALTADGKGYYALCYMAENTLPSVEAMIKGLSTGIAFNMFICDKEGKPVTPDIFISQSEYDDLVQDRADLEAALAEANEAGDEAEIARIEGLLTEKIASLEKMVVGSLAQKENASGSLYELKIGSQSVDAIKTRVTYLKESTTEVDGQTVTTKDKVSSDAFILTYYYIFRHNMDLKHYYLGYTGPMQFAVVRNNIYKVSVTALNSLPEPYDPSEKDEPENNYISVETAILSWARVDNPDVNL